jgi:lysophospholipase L1-like esterase
MPLPTNLTTDYTAGDTGHVEAHEATNTRVNAIATEVNAHEADTTAVHGIADTAALATTAAVAAGYQPLDADLTGLAGLGNGNPYRAAGTWAVRSDATLATALGVDGGGSGLTSAQTALIKLYAAVANRDAEAVIVHVDGDSYTQSFGSSYWPNRVSAYLQGRYPKLTGSEVAPSTDTATARGSRTAGVQVVNGAVGGQRSDNFLTGSEATAVAALEPCAYLWMIGTNDTANGITAAAHKTNLLAAIAYQKAHNPRPCVFVLIHPFERMDTYTAASPWADYGTVEQEIADADPDNVVAIDLGPPFELAGVPGTDSFGLVNDGDDLHPTGAGQALMADLIWSALESRNPLGAGAASPPSRLTNSVAPAISGTATTGQTLTAGTGTWNASPDSYTYVWKRAGSAISGATSSTYVLQLADEGSAITVTVTAIKAGYTSGSATSSSVTPSVTTVVNTVAPAITGTTTEGQTLTVSNGTWNVTPDSYSYVWKRGGSAISGATASTYVLVTADVGTTITCTVTAVKSGLTSGSATASGVGPIGAAAPSDPTDTFNRSNNSTSLGTPSDAGAAYVTSGTHGIISNAAYSPGGESSAYYIRPLSGSAETDAYVEATIVNGTMSKVCLFLGASNGQGYVCFLGLGSDGDAQLWRYDGGYSSTGIGFGGTVPWAAGDVVRLEKVGSAIKLYRNGTQVGSTGTDTAISTVTHGGVHLYTGNTTYRIDTLTMGAL